MNLRATCSRNTRPRRTAQPGHNGVAAWARWKRWTCRVVVAGAWMCAAGAAPATPLVCGASLGASTPGNRRCASADEKKAINKLINGKWVIGACHVQHPLGWRVVQDRQDGPITILPNPTSLLAPLNFRATVIWTSRPMTNEEREKTRLLKKWSYTERLSEKYPDFEAWVVTQMASTGTRRAVPSAPTPPDDMDFRYVGGRYEGRAEGSEEYAGTARIRHDDKNQRWQVGYNIKTVPGMDGDPGGVTGIARYQCQANDDMSIDVFAMLCTAVWESSMLSEDPSLGDCSPD